MICSKCFKEFPERDLELSHDVPRYMFSDRKEADKWGRHHLCKKCHDTYERMVFAICFRKLSEEWKDTLRKSAKAFSERYFNDGPAG